MIKHNIPDYDWRNAHKEWGRGLRYFQKKLKEANISSGKVLDVGCGCGSWVDAADRLGCDVTGIDIRETRIEIASIFCSENTNLIVGSAEDLPFEDNTFDSVICQGVLMFVDATKTLKEIKRVSKKKSILLLCWNAIGWSYKLVANKNISMSIRKSAAETIAGVGKVSCYSFLDMTKLLTDAGYTEMEKIKTTAYPRYYQGMDCVLEGIARSE